MTQSSLTDAYLPVYGKCYSPRAYGISKVTVHHMAGDLSIEGCQSVFNVPGREASSNYGIDSYGRIGCYVQEEDAAWTSSSWWNDNQAITIEVADEDCSNWVPSDAAYKATVLLCADICNRYGIYPTYTGDTDGTFTEHMMYAATGCPGPWWHSHMSQFVQDVRDAMEGDMTPSDLMNADISTQAGGNIPVWQAWSWAYTYAKEANDRCAKMEKDISEIKSLIKKGSTEIPCITKEPLSVNAKIGEKAEFSVAASGLGLSYRWQYHSAKANTWYNITASDYDGLQTSKMTVPVTAKRNGCLYRCKITNAAGVVCTKEVKLTVEK